MPEAPVSAWKYPHVHPGSIQATSFLNHLGQAELKISISMLLWVRWTGGRQERKS